MTPALRLPGIGPTIALVAALGAAVVVAVSGDVIVRVLALSVAGITLMATRVLPDIATAVLIFLAFLGLRVAAPEVVFSGFMTGGFWLLIGGLIMGTAIASSGLGDQVAMRLHARTGGSYRRAVWLLSISGLVLGVLVPSAIPRVIIMMPITLSLAAIMGHAPGSRAQTGLLITAATMTLMPTYAFLPANLPTIVELGAIEALYGETIGYGAFLAGQAPMALVRLGVLMVLMLGWKIGEVAPVPPVDAARAAPLTGAQRRLLALLGVAVALWATDFWHGIPPAWVTLGAATVLLIPAFGVLSAQAMKTEIDLSIAFLIAGVFCISAVIAHVGLDARLADILVPALYLGQWGSLWDLFAITTFSAGLSHLTTAPAAPVALAPLAGSMAEATGWSIMTVAQAHNIGFSTTLMPHQSPPLLISMAMARIPFGPLLRVCLWSSLWSALIGIPVTWVWWGWIGLI